MRNKSLDKKKYFDALKNRKEEASKFSKIVRKQLVNKGHSKSVLD
jgi:hypothetical protein